jgi:hypothetical protein
LNSAAAAVNPAVFNLPSIRRLSFALALLLTSAGRPVHAQTTPASGNPSRINLPALPGASSAPAAGSADIHDLHNLVPLTYWERNGTWIIISSIAGVVLLGVVIALLLRKKPAVRLTPHQIALRELEAARALAKDGQDKIFASAASDAVRHYLENAYHMPAPERTTEEFLAEASRHAWLRGELAGLLRRFLEFCDLAKFAGQQLGATEREQLLGAAREFLHTAEKLRQPPPAAKSNLPAKPPTVTPPAPAEPPADPPAKPTLTAS